MELLAVLPTWYVYSVTFVFGLVIGSFLNVLLYRFRTGKSINGSSHCLSCATRLKWFELLPVVSYVVLRGRCRTCASYIPVRYVTVELLTATMVTLLVLPVTSAAIALLSMLLAALLVMVVVYDINHLIIPDEFVVALSLGALSLWMATGGGVTELTTAAYAALLAATFYWSLWKVSAGRWIGFGDVKLALPLGFMVSLGGVFSMIVLSFWVGAIVSVSLLVMERIKQGKTRPQNSGTKLTMKSEVPFAPFMVAAFLIVYVLEIDVLQLFMW